jgi:DsbC/DsbD-like thiol-disulfide interchange protein
MTLARFALALGLAFAAATAAAQPAVRGEVFGEGVAFRLLPGPPGGERTAWAVLAVDLEPGWKFYWIAPGPFGIAPEADWSGSRNLASAALRWPLPERIVDADMDPHRLTVGWTRSFLAPLEAVRARAGEGMEIRLTLEYGVCKELCVADRAVLALRVGASAPDRAATSAVAASRAPCAAAAPDRVVALRAEGTALHVELAYAVDDIFIAGPQSLFFGPPEAVAATPLRRNVAYRIPAFTREGTAIVPARPAGALRLVFARSGQASEFCAELP